MIKYYSLSSIPFPLCSRFIVFFSGKTKYFLTFKDKKEFISEYKKIPDFLRHYYEVISTKLRKMVLDIDIPLTEQEIVYIKEELERLILFLTGKHVVNLVFKSSDSKKTTYHIVVPKLMFTIQECKYIADQLDSREEIFDRGVYKRIQFFRIEGSTKYRERRYKYLLNRGEISEYIYEGLVGDVCNRKTHEECNLYHKTLSTCSINNIEIEENYLKLQNEYNFLNIENINEMFPEIRGQFRVRKQVTKCLINLSRVNQGYCPLCKRIHENENGYIVFKKGRWNLYCFRNNKLNFLVEHF